jgi:hypothetical protein
MKGMMMRLREDPEKALENTHRPLVMVVGASVAREVVSARPGPSLLHRLSLGLRLQSPDHSNHAAVSWSASSQASQRTVLRLRRIPEGNPARLAKRVLLQGSLTMVMIEGWMS